MTSIINYAISLIYFYTGFHWIIGFIRSWIFIRLPLVIEQLHTKTTVAKKLPL